MTRYLRFASEAEYLQYKDLIDSLTSDVIGNIVHPPVTRFHFEGEDERMVVDEVISPAITVEGFHVNCVQDLPTELLPFEVFPKNPIRNFQ